MKLHRRRSGDRAVKHAAKPCCRAELPGHAAVPSEIDESQPPPTIRHRILSLTAGDINADLQVCGEHIRTSARLRHDSRVSMPQSLRRLSSLLITRREALLAGISDARLQHAVKKRELVRLSPGYFARIDDWADLPVSEQHLLRTICANEAAQMPPVFSHTTAALLLGLPVFNLNTDRVHTLSDAARTLRSTPHVVRHRGECSDSELDETGGIRHTGLTRTVLDIARYGTPEQAFVTGDAGLRRLVSLSGEPRDRVVANLLMRLADMPRSKGYRRAIATARLLDSAAETPLESLFRLQFLRLGFEVRTQVPVRGPRSGNYFVDFELVGYDVFFEADGKTKYMDERFRNGRSPAEAVVGEKYREDWIRGVTNKRVLRGGWEHAISAQATAERLLAFGVIPLSRLSGERTGRDFGIRGLN